MKSTERTHKQLSAENDDLRARLDEAEETLRAIRDGEVDALIVSGAGGEQIYTRKQAEDALEESEAKFRRLVEHLPSVVYMNAVGGSSSTLYVSPQIKAQLGYTQEEWLADPTLWSQLLHPEDRRQVLERAAAAVRDNGPFDMEYRMLARDGRLVWVHDQAVLVNDLEGQPKFRQGIMLDLTARRQAEEAARETQARFEGVVSTAVEAIISVDEDQRVILFNQGAERIFGYSAAEAAGLSLAEFLPLATAGLHRGPVQSFGAVDDEGSRRMGNLRSIRGRQRDGTHFPAEVNISKTTVKGKPVYTAIVRDITERTQAEERMQRQLEHLTAMGAIDRVIAANFDLGLSLTEILTHVTTELGVDAAGILVFNAASQTLESGAERGFRSKASRKTQVRLGESFAGRAAMERQLIQIPDLMAEPVSLFVKTHLRGEDFVCYYGVPLIAKGQVKGVLEIFHRAALDPDEEWFDFLASLAGQAAIAIENATLFESLQRSNSELTLAYDATIEGWSRALDLRDKETEGHTKRVTEMTLKLAIAFGLGEAELVQVRWGALLHDIGKMGVPDGILLKPGDLTEEEWLAMKQHPSLAHEMLSPIRYLRQALDIPYCHHEKWDGSGYPRGLRGDLIPLVARIFAVVDVWDALSSDRPYRPAWAKDKVYEYIRTAAGTHFDPKVVDVFLQMLNAV